MNISQSLSNLIEQPLSTETLTTLRQRLDAAERAATQYFWTMVVACFVGSAVGFAYHAGSGRQDLWMLAAAYAISNTVVFFSMRACRAGAGLSRMPVGLWVDGRNQLMGTSSIPLEDAPLSAELQAIVECNPRAKRFFDAIRAQGREPVVFERNLMRALCTPPAA